MTNFISYALKLLITAALLLCLTHSSFAQHIYQINADSVRIYNNCDTAELILENHTQDTLGFLYNKGKGRTEFRRLQLEKVNDSKLAIVGQDTLDLGLGNAILPRIITATTTLDDTYSIIMCDNNSNIDIHLPPVATCSGHTYTIKKRSADLIGAVLIYPATGELIDGHTRISLVFSQDAYTIQSDGTGWNVLSSSFPLTRFIVNSTASYFPGEFHLFGESSIQGTFTCDGSIISNGTLEVHGGMNFATVTTGQDLILDETYYTIIATPIYTMTITLPAASECKGRTYVIKKVVNNTNAISLVSNGGLIEGATTQTITGYKQCATLQSDGENWYLIGAVGFSGW